MKIAKKIVAMLLPVFFILLISSCGKESESEPIFDIRRPDEAFLKYGDEYTNIVELNKINDSVWIHTSYYEIKGSLTSLNGLVILTDKGLVLVNAPWTGKQMDSLGKLAIEHFNSRFRGCIATEAMTENADGMRFLMEGGIGVTCLERVAEKAEMLGLFKADHILAGDDGLVECGDVTLELYFPGEGYSDTNSIVWIDKFNLLFAGNIIKEHGALSLGSHGEGSKEAWPGSLNNIIDRYEDIEIVVPGHGQWGDASLIDYTLGLFEE